ncbi:MAG: PadR family transcriptional regulator [Chroococcidiopsidaceae cyanobacterium CP_BM_RX_35]|nr:PadR family transcriptional regulator [Chroococcidiopsidaceae cyanobacterium CP_BM_RX_35]
MALAHAILVSLMDSLYTGYDLAKQFDSSVGFFWKASHQQIYHELAKLEASGWVSAEIVPQEGRPDKKLYQVTELGEQQLIEWLKKPCELSPTKDELLVKLRAGYLIPLPEIMEELERHRQIHQKKLSLFQELERRIASNPQKLPPNAKFRYLILRRGIHYETDWLAWCDEVIQVLGNDKTNST